MSRTGEFSPVLLTAGQVASDVGGVPEIGLAAKAVAGLKATSIRLTTSKTKWFIRTTPNMRHKNVIYHGAEWELSHNLLKEVGGRIGGSLLVGFTEASTSVGGSNDRDVNPADPPVLAKAELSGPDGASAFIPAEEPSGRYVELGILKDLLGR